MLVFNEREKRIEKKIYDTSLYTTTQYIYIHLYN